VHRKRLIARWQRRLVGAIACRRREPSVLARLVVRLLALEREGQTVAVQAQPGLMQTALEQTGVALQGVQGVGPFRRDHRAQLSVAMELEAHLDAAERGRLELDDQAIDPPGIALAICMPIWNTGAGGTGRPGARAASDTAWSARGTAASAASLPGSSQASGAGAAIDRPVAATNERTRAAAGGATAESAPPWSDRPGKAAGAVVSAVSAIDVVSGRAPEALLV
jgi:hypothetical protein